MFSFGLQGLLPYGCGLPPPISEPSMETTDYRELCTIATDGSPLCGATSVHFDKTYELLWVGNEKGLVTSYCGPSMEKYSSFHVSPRNNPVVEMLSIKDGLLTLTKDNLSFSNKRGKPLYNFSNEVMQETQCMTIFKGNSVLLAGRNSALLQVDMNAGSIVNSKPQLENEATAIFRSTSKYLCCGGFNGKVMLRDPDSLKIQHTLDAHSGTISDFDVNGHKLITCGFSKIQWSCGGPSYFASDPFVKMYDLRMMKDCTFLQCAMHPSFLRFLSAQSRRMLVVSQSGQFRLIDDDASVTPNTDIYQASLSGTSIVNIDVSSSTQALVFGDSDGSLHLWSDSSCPSFNYFQNYPIVEPYSTPNDVIQEDPMVPQKMEEVSKQDENGEKATESDLPEEGEEQTNLEIVPENPRKVSQNIEEVSKQNENGGKATESDLPEEGEEQTNLDIVPEKTRKVSQKIEEVSMQDENGEKATESDLLEEGEEQTNLDIVPEKYRKVALKYSKLGETEKQMVVRCNKTNFAGLEADTPNSFCNNMLQVLYFIEPLRCGLQSHHNLNKEFDLAEELGFLFHMQDSARGGILQAKNFLRAFRSIPEAKALQLVKAFSKSEKLPSGDAYTDPSQLIQRWNRFILRRLHKDTLPSVNLSSSKGELPVDSTNDDIAKNKDAMKTEYEKRSVVEKIFGTEIQISNQFRNGKTEVKKTVQLVHDLKYPTIPNPGQSKQSIPFSTITRNSLSSQTRMTFWDKDSGSYQVVVQTKTLTLLPDALAINCSLRLEEDRHLWKKQNELFAKKFEDKISNENKKVQKEAYERNGKESMFKEIPATSGDVGHEFADKESLDSSFAKRGSSSWIPLNLTMLINTEGKLVVQSETDLDFDKERKDISHDPNAVHYELFASVAHIDDSRTGGNVVAHINVGETYHQRKEGVTHNQWYLFNDFQVSPIEMKEAVDFDLKWKFPCVLYYKRVDINDRHHLQVNFPLTSDILSPTPNIAERARHSRSSSVDQLSSESLIMLTPLSEKELPKEPGRLYALDAEYVRLKGEVTELQSDGTTSIIEPCHHSIARVTVVRGEGPLEGKPFIDDYIATKEHIEDYVTKYSGFFVYLDRDLPKANHVVIRSHQLMLPNEEDASLWTWILFSCGTYGASPGIKPGDLDVMTSSKHLSTLKSFYCKLRYLIQCGCTFVGHGLMNDFKVLNICVPEEQVKDTAQLFRINSSTRFLSLKFLTWYYFREIIQKDTHDSVEDSKAALKLYKKYLELTEGETKLYVFKRIKLIELYDDASIMDWKVPEVFLKSDSPLK